MDNNSNDDNNNHNDGHDNGNHNNNDGRTNILDILRPAIRQVLRRSRIAGGQQATPAQHSYITGQTSGTSHTNNLPSVPLADSPVPSSEQEDVPMASLPS